MTTTTGTCRGFRGGTDTDPCQNCGSDYGRHGGTIRVTTIARTEYSFAWDGAPTISPVFADRADVEDYIASGVAAGQDRSRYSIISRGVVMVTTDWTDAR